MKKNKVLTQLNSIAESSDNWLKDAQNRIENRKRLVYSQEIALRILRELRSQNKTQTDLAKALSLSKQQINRWVKGKENFTLDTIAKIDAALDIRLLSIETESDKSYQTLWVTFEKTLTTQETYNQSIESNYTESQPLKPISIDINSYQTITSKNKAS